MVMDEYDCCYHKTDYDMNHIGNVCTNTNLEEKIEIMYEYYKKNNPLPLNNIYNFTEKNDRINISNWFKHNKYDSLEILDSRRVECLGERISDYKRNEENVHYNDQFDWFLIQTWLCVEEKVNYYNNIHTINLSSYNNNNDIAEDFIFDFVLQHPESTHIEHKQVIEAINKCAIYGKKILNAFEHRYTTCVGIKFGYIKNNQNNCINYFDNSNDNYDYYIVKVWNSHYVHITNRLEEKNRIKYLIERWIETYIPNSKLLRLTYKEESKSEPCTIKLVSDSEPCTIEHVFDSEACTIEPIVDSESKIDIKICDYCEKNSKGVCMPMIVMLKNDIIMQICGRCYWERTCYHMVKIGNNKPQVIDAGEIAGLLYKNKSNNYALEHFKNAIDFYIRKTFPKRKNKR